MSGQSLRVIPRQGFDFSYLASAEDETRVVAGKIPTAQFTDGWLLVRVHNKTIAAGGGTPGTITVAVVLDGSTNEDPGNDFLKTTAITGGSIAVSNGSGTVGDFEFSKITGDLGSMVAIAVVASQDESTSGLSLAADISVDLILKSS